MCLYVEYCTEWDHGGGEWTLCSGEQAESCFGWRKHTSHHQHHQGNAPLQCIGYFLLHTQMDRRSVLDMVESCSLLAHKHSLLFVLLCPNKLLWLLSALIKKNKSLPNIWCCSSLSYNPRWAFIELPHECSAWIVAQTTAISMYW